MWIALDIIVVAVIAAFGWRGWRRGVISAAISIGITLVAALLAYIISAPVSESVYKDSIQPIVVETLQSGLEKLDAVPIIQDAIKEQFDVEIADEDIDRIVQSDDVKSELADIAQENGEDITVEEIDEKWSELVSTDTLTELVGDGVPEKMIESVSSALSESEDNISTVVKVVLSDDSESAAHEIEQSMFRDKITGITRAVTAFILFAGIACVLQIVYFILRRVKLIPSLQALLKIPGALVGIAEGVLLFAVVGICISSMIHNSYGILSFLSADVIDKTFIFKLFVR